MDRCVGGVLLGHMVTLCLTFGKLTEAADSQSCSGTLRFHNGKVQGELPTKLFKVIKCLLSSP